MTKCPDGKYRAVANELIIKNREFLIAYYENETAAELKQNGFGITMTKYETGNSRYATIDGIPEEVNKHFSKRSEQIDKAVGPLMEQYPNASREELRQIACLGTRQTKQTIDQDVLHDSWNAQLNSLEHTPESLATSMKDAYKKSKVSQIDLIKPTEQEIVQKACTVINEQESTFSREDALKTAARLSGGNFRNSELEKAFYELKGSTIVTLDKNAGAYTTRVMKRIEKGIVTAVKKGHDTIPEILTVPQVEERTKELYNNFTDDQKKALKHILTSTDKVIWIQGDAGTGKTTMLRGAREQLEAHGYTVRGLSFTGKAAKELQAGAGIDSKTIHSFLPHIDSPQFSLSSKEAKENQDFFPLTVDFQEKFYAAGRIPGGFFKNANRRSGNLRRQFSRSSAGLCLRLRGHCDDRSGQHHGAAH